MGVLYAFLANKDTKEAEHSKDIATLTVMTQQIVTKLDELKDSLIEYEKRTELNTQDILYMKDSIQKLKGDNMFLINIIESNKMTAEALQKITKILDKT